MTDFNTNRSNTPDYYDCQGDKEELQAQKPGGDYGPPHNVCIPAQEWREPLPDGLKFIFRPRKKRILLKVASIILCAAVILGAVGTGVIVEYKQSQDSSTGSSDGNEQLAVYDNLPDEVEIYVTPEDQIVELKIEDINRSLEELSLNEIYEQCITSVVDITAVNEESGSLGTGIIMDSRGFILTNAHIVEDALRVFVTLSTKLTYEAKLVGMDSDMDIAVLKIEAKNLPAASFGDSDQLLVGDSVAVIGDPTVYTELRGTLTNGIISALDRSMDISVRLIQTNAAINTGNSGGPVINAYGQVVGITVMKMTSSQKNIEGLGFAIPVSSIKTAVEEIIRKGEYEYPAIGIVGKTVSAEMSAAYGIPQGVYVDSVMDEAAENGCGLQPGDVITDVDGAPISDMDGLNDKKYRHAVGEVMQATVVRGTKIVTVDVPMLHGSVISSK